MTKNRFLRRGARGWIPGWILLVLLIPPQLPLVGQGPGPLRVQTVAGLLDPGLTVRIHQGFPAVPARELGRLGWDVEEEDEGVTARWQGQGPSVELRTGTPFLSWDGESVQLADAPYSASEGIFLPLQFFIDILPWKLPRAFQFEVATRTLQVLESEGSSGIPSDPVRVVVIDPGHGGRDPGARGATGTREKEIALAIGRELARELRSDPGLVVHLTRESDTLIPLWKRGEMATGWRGEDTGVFLSIHANAMPNSRATRGFETFFLSEARTEYGRRLTALENSAQEFETPEEGPHAMEDMSFILKDLMNRDHQRWSSLLAEMVQDRMAEIHPGPDRGVKQGLLAVITNAMMPAVLVEVGFLTNPEEERLLRQSEFQADAARAIARAVRDFFQRYPGGESP